MKNYLTNMFWGPTDHDAFANGVQKAINQVAPNGIFTGDNIFTFGRNLSFLDDEKFMAAFSQHVETDAEKAVIWRTHVLCWAAQQSMHIDGDFVECGCYKGISARIVCDYVEIKKSNKHYYLYDLFEHKQDMSHHSMPEHSTHLYSQFKQRFSDLKQIHVTKGLVPDVLHSIAPEKISFINIEFK